MKRAAGDGRNAKLSLELQRRLSDANREHRVSLDALQEAVCDYFDDLRRVGLERDQAIDSVKSFIADLMSKTARKTTAATMGRIDDEHLMVLIADWCADRWETPEL